MTLDDLLTALGLPPAAFVNRRVPKTLLIEHGAPTASDKRIIEEGIVEARWVAALKPTTIGVPPFRDEARDYLEIAVLAASLRPEAKALRLRELFHRAIPYPLVLASQQGESLTLSLGHLRKSQGEKDTYVLDGEIKSGTLGPDHPGDVTSFLARLRLDTLPRDNLHALYEGWIDAVLALSASLVTGRFAPSVSPEASAARAAALEEHVQLTREVERLRAQAARETQAQRRVELNLAIRRLTERLSSLAASL